MCDVKKFNQIADEIMNLDFDDFGRLIAETENEQKKKLFMNMYTYFISTRQEEVLKEHIY